MVLFTAAGQNKRRIVYCLKMFKIGSRSKKFEMVRKTLMNGGAKAASQRHLLQFDFVSGRDQHIFTWKFEVGDCDGMENANHDYHQSLYCDWQCPTIVRVNLLDWSLRKTIFSKKSAVQTLSMLCPCVPTLLKTMPISAFKEKRSAHGPFMCTNRLYHFNLQIIKLLLETLTKHVSHTPEIECQKMGWSFKFISWVIGKGRKERHCWSRKKKSNRKNKRTDSWLVLFLAIEKKEPNSQKPRRKRYSPSVASKSNQQDL